MGSIKEKLMFCLDMDGTIYHEDMLIPGAKEFFSLLEKQGKGYVFMTNNSSRSKEAYVKKLNALGIKATSAHIVSSVNATIGYLKVHKPGAKIYLVGTKSFRDELRKEGFRIVPATYRGAGIDYVVVGFDTELNYEKIRGACHYVSRHVPYLATNCDMRCPVKERCFIPDCGAICQMIEVATGKKPFFLGKPDTYILEMVSKEWGVAKENMLCIGDRLYTDIAIGINAGVDTAVVLTGETSAEDIVDTAFKPTYCFQSINDIYEVLAGITEPCFISR